jgi:hypothetical protein
MAVTVIGEEEEEEEEEEGFSDTIEDGAMTAMTVTRCQCVAHVMLMWC